MSLDHLSATLAALADLTRRAFLAQSYRTRLSSLELAKPFDTDLKNDGYRSIGG
ncbi:MAG: hypothetical protein KME45_12490 [Stenomitos rutilans HA7619-LM2]|jgi:alpha-D-ribose 1-methylphosphonate 5-triphosphate synthase subunit PhnI|nr:hypothetical protein [Stenomitos rutilans HA7619-LM2]